MPLTAKALRATLLFGGATFAALPAAAELTVFDYAGFEVPAFHTAFVETHGRSPKFAFFGEEDEAFQKLSSGFRADVTHICAGSVPKFSESGLLEPWDLSRIPNWENLNKDLTGEKVGETEEVFFVPDAGTAAGTIGYELLSAITARVPRLYVG